MFTEISPSCILCIDIHFCSPSEVHSIQALSAALSPSAARFKGVSQDLLTLPQRFNDILYQIKSVVNSFIYKIHKICRISFDANKNSGYSESKGLVSDAELYMAAHIAAESANTS